MLAFIFVSMGTAKRHNIRFYTFKKRSRRSGANADPAFFTEKFSVEITKKIY
jgi:hypothetical protein